MNNTKQIVMDEAECDLILENISDDPTTALLKWQELEEVLAYAKVKEMNFRKKIMDHFFPNPKSGVNNHPLPANYVLKGTPTVNVTLQEELLPVVKAELEAMGENINAYLKWKPSLNTTWSDRVKAAQASETPDPVVVAMRAMITTSPGAPKLEIVLPAKFQK